MIDWKSLLDLRMEILNRKFFKLESYSTYDQYLRSENFVPLGFVVIYLMSAVRTACTLEMRCLDIETEKDKGKASYEYTWKKDNDENSTVKTGVITSKEKLECAEAAPGELYVIYYTSNDIKRLLIRKSFNSRSKTRQRRLD